MKFNKKFLVYLLFFIFLIAYLILSIGKHYLLETDGDLALYTQFVWLTSRFSLPDVSLKFTDKLFFADHFNPSLVLLSPLFWIFPNAVSLLFVQALLISLGFLLIFSLAKEKLKNFWLSLSIAIAYILFIGIQSALDFEFHLATMAAGFLLLCFYFYEKKKFFLYWLVFFIALGFKEDISLYLFIYGLWLFFMRKDKRIGFFSMTIAALWFYLVVFVFIPLLNGQSANNFSQVHYMDNAGFSFLMLSTKIKTLIFSFAGFAFLPLLSSFSLLLFLPNFFSRFFSGFEARWTLHFHYSAVLGPIFALGIISTIQKIKHFSRKKRFRWNNFRNLIIISLFSATILTNLFQPEKDYQSFPLLRIFRRSFYRWIFLKSEKIKTINKIIPPNISLLTQHGFSPHLAARRKIYHNLENLKNIPSDFEYALFDWEENPSPIKREKLEEIIGQFSQDPDYELIFQKDKMFIFKFNAQYAQN